MKQALILLLFCCSFTSLVAQTYDINNLRVSSYSHNYECGSDGFFSDPNPNFLVKWRVVGGVFGSNIVVNPGAPDKACGTHSANRTLSPSTYNGTANSLEFYIESWEDDDCGSADTFDDDCLTNDDDIYADISETVVLSIAGSQTHTFTMSNGYTITIAYDLAILPVELLHFEAVSVEKAVGLNWLTSRESNSFEFEVQRSAEGRDFKTIGILDAAGDSDIELEYEFMDDSPLPFAYYRLKNVDLDGYFEYSEVLTVRRNTADIFIEKIYPNPAETYINISLNLPHTNKTQLSYVITDITGRIVKTGAAETEQNEDVTLNVADLSFGQYFISFNDGNSVVTERFVLGAVMP